MTESLLFSRLSAAAEKAVEADRRARRPCPQRAVRGARNGRTKSIPLVRIVRHLSRKHAQWLRRSPGFLSKFVAWHPDVVGVTVSVKQARRWVQGVGLEGEGPGKPMPPKLLSRVEGELLKVAERYGLNSTVAQIVARIARRSRPDLWSRAKEGGLRSVFRWLPIPDSPSRPDLGLTFGERLLRRARQTMEAPCP